MLPLLRVDLGGMAMKGAPLFPKLQHHWNIIIGLFSVISWTLAGRGLTPFAWRVRLDWAKLESELQLVSSRLHDAFENSDHSQQFGCLDGLNSPSVPTAFPISCEPFQQHQVQLVIQTPLCSTVRLFVFHSSCLGQIFVNLFSFLLFHCYLPVR